MLEVRLCYCLRQTNTQWFLVRLVVSSCWQWRSPPSCPCFRGRRRRRCWSASSCPTFINPARRRRPCAFRARHYNARGDDDGAHAQSGHHGGSYVGGYVGMMRIKYVRGFRPSIFPRGLQGRSLVCGRHDGWNLNYYCSCVVFLLLVYYNKSVRRVVHDLSAGIDCWVANKGKDSRSCCSVQATWRWSQVLRVHVILYMQRLLPVWSTVLPTRWSLVTLLPSCGKRWY